MRTHAHRACDGILGLERRLPDRLHHRIARITRVSWIEHAVNPETRVAVTSALLLKEQFLVLLAIRWRAQGGVRRDEGRRRNWKNVVSPFEVNDSSCPGPLWHVTLDL